MESQRNQLSQLEAALASSHRSVTQLSEKLSLANETLERLSFYDVLTGLPNRRHFHEGLSHFIALARREHRPLPVLLIDFNRFREINDKLGHEVGDRTLRELADRLIGSVRDSDVVARIGGDEFAVMLPSTESMPGAQIVAQKIVDATEKPFEVDGHSLLMGVSIGIAMYPDHGVDNHAILQQADRSMGEAKRAGGGYVISRAKAESETNERVVLAGDLREAIEKKQLVLHYQPKIELSSQRVIGGEALVRWQHPSEGLIFPDEFIPVVENTGVINIMTYEILKDALAWVCSWREQGYSHSVAVNLSPRSLHDRDLPNRVARMLDERQAPPEALVLEITESAIMIDADRAKEAITALDEHGVGIAIDDFGTGYSSLAYLRRLPATEIKIDKSFVMKMDTNSDDAAIVRSVVELGRNLGKRVVAEGIESEEVLHMLADMGCEAGQGYHISRPIPADAYSTWMDGRAAD
jgi:diguanylate cyclase (GGDEF)-like protein